MFPFQPAFAFLTGFAPPFLSEPIEVPDSPPREVVPSAPSGAVSIPAPTPPPMAKDKVVTRETVPAASAVPAANPSQPAPSSQDFCGSFDPLGEVDTLAPKFQVGQHVSLLFFATFLHFLCYRVRDQRSQWE